jgi:hypothetical protein
MAFNDERYVFKRYINMGPVLDPWLVPESGQVGCEANIKPEMLQVPQTASTGRSLYDYYEFRITPDSVLFFGKITGRELQEPFGVFITQDFERVISHIRIDMASELMRGFDRRDHNDPVPYFEHRKTVFFK